MIKLINLYYFIYIILKFYYDHSKVLNEEINQTKFMQILID